jgi:hypothetical protein
LKEEDPETKIISENKKILKLSLTKNLQTNTKYKLIVKKVININLDNDIVIDFVTSPSLEMKDFIFVSYSKSCMYLNNWISDVWKKSNDFITTFPSSKINSVSDYEYIDYQDQVKLAIKNNDSNTAIPSNEKYLEL